MNEYYKIGITKLRLQSYDLDGDGTVGDIENVTVKANISEIIPASQKSETAEAVENLNKDEVDASRLSTIDFLSRINPHEYDAMTKIDALIALKFLPSSVSWINRSKMRKSVSLKGEGRKEFVNLITGKDEKKERVGGFGSFMGIKEKE